MIIEWYTIIFQGINFLILVFLLRRFLYRPIMETMDEREATILKRESDAKEAREAGERAVEEAQAREAELEAKKDQVLAAAQKEAAEKRREWLNEARKEVDQSREQWQEGLRRERETFLSELRRQLAQQACRIARHCLTDIADARLEDWVWQEFLKQVKALSDESFRPLLEAGEPWILRSAFPADESVEEERLEQLQDILGDRLPSRPSLQMEEDPDQICGFELEAGAHRVVWSVNSYLDGVEGRIMQELAEGPNAWLDGEVDA